MTTIDNIRRRLLGRRDGGRTVESGITRRALIAGSPAILAIAAAPSVARALEPAESISDKVDRLTLELSEALDEYLNGQFLALVAPAGAVSLHPKSQYRLVRVPKDAHHRLEAAAMEFQTAYENLHNDVEDWHVVRDRRSHIRMLVPVIAASDPVKWSGDGRYVVQEGEHRPSYWITREARYDDGGERWFRVSTGFKGPNERPDYLCPEHHLPKIVRKSSDGARA
jgi:hypothetical protein